MRYYKIKIANDDNYIISVDSSKKVVPELRTLVGNLELSLFATQEGGYIFETKEKKYSFWLRAYSNETLEITKLSKKNISIKKISETEMKNLNYLV